MQTHGLSVIASAPAGMWEPSNSSSSRPLVSNHSLVIHTLPTLYYDGIALEERRQTAAAEI
jgi:hypothetical protein